MFKKTIAIVIAVIIVTCVFAACGDSVSTETQAAETQTEETAAPEETAEAPESIGMPNPMVEVNSPDDFINALNAPEGTTIISCYVIDEKMDDLTFTDEKGNEYNARATFDEECEDPEIMTGFHGEWTYQEGMGDIRYATVKIDSDEYYVAYWQKDDNDGKTFYTLVGPKSCEDQIIAYAEEMAGLQ